MSQDPMTSQEIEDLREMLNKPTIIFQDTTSNCIWTDKQINFAIIDTDFYIEELDILSRKYFIKLDHFSRNSENYRLPRYDTNDYLLIQHSIWNYFYKNLNSIKIRNDIWNLLKSTNNYNTLPISTYDLILNEVYHEIDYLRDNYNENNVIFDIESRTKDNINFLLEKIQDSDIVEKSLLLDFVKLKINETNQNHVTKTL